jgi:hypothetical protein
MRGGGSAGTGAALRALRLALGPPARVDSAMADSSRYDYAWEKLHLAVTGLAMSEDSLQDRLRDAYVYHLIDIDREDLLPPAIADDYERLKHLLTRVKASGDEGDAAASARALSDFEAGDLIRTVVSMYDRVTRSRPSQ